MAPRESCSEEPGTRLLLLRLEGTTNFYHTEQTFRDCCRSDRPRIKDCQVLPSPSSLLQAPPTSQVEKQP